MMTASAFDFSLMQKPRGHGVLHSLVTPCLGMAVSVLPRSITLHSLAGNCCKLSEWQFPDRRCFCNHSSQDYPVMARFCWGFAWEKHMGVLLWLTTDMQNLQWTTSFPTYKNKLEKCCRFSIWIYKDQAKLPQIHRCKLIVHSDFESHACWQEST